jgi:hypothetical protein
VRSFVCLNKYDKLGLKSIFGTYFVAGHFAQLSVDSGNQPEAIIDFGVSVFFRNIEATAQGFDGKK